MSATEHQEVQTVTTPSRQFATAPGSHLRPSQRPESLLRFDSNPMEGNASVDDNKETVESETVESSDGSGHVGSQENSIVEPYIGMEFESDEAARVFYARYAAHVGFLMRLGKARRSERDGSIIGRILVCNKEGFRRFRPEITRHKPVTREGCKALIVLRKEKIGKWVVTKFVKEHCHPLVVTPAKTLRRKLLTEMPDDKDVVIRELTAELHREKKRCAFIQRQLDTVLRDMEEHSQCLTRSIEGIAKNLKQIE